MKYRFCSGLLLLLDRVIPIVRVIPFALPLVLISLSSCGAGSESSEQAIALKVDSNGNTLTAFWNGQAELAEDDRTFGDEFSMHFLSTHWENSTLFTYYIRTEPLTDGTYKTSTHLALSKDGVSFEDKGRVLEGDTSGSRDTRIASFPSVIKRGGTWYMLYEGASDSSLEVHGELRLAVSANGTNWEKLTNDSGAPIDHDFYKVGTITSPDDITNNMFTQGNLAIGKTTADYTLDIQTEGEKGVNVTINGNTGGLVYGAHHTINNTHQNALNYGTYNDFSSSVTGNMYGTVNRFDPDFLPPLNNHEIHGVHNILLEGGNSAYSTANRSGVYNLLSGNASPNEYGTYTKIASSGGEHYGNYNELSGLTQNKYGVYNLFPYSAGPSDYRFGVYNDIDKAEESVGVFNALKNSAQNGMGKMYGVYNEMIEGNAEYKYGIYNSFLHGGGRIFGNYTIIQGTITEGVGCYNYLDAHSPLPLTGTINSIYNHSNNLNSIGTKNSAHTGTYNTSTIGVKNSVGLKGVYNIVSTWNEDGDSSYGVFTELNNNHGGGGNGISYGNRQETRDSGTGNKYGTYSYMDTITGGKQYLLYNDIHSTSTESKYGTYNHFDQVSNGTHYGTYTNMSGVASNDKYGNYTFIDPAGTGNHYGVYSEVLKSGGYAAYLLGDVSIGTTTANNYIFPASRGTNGQVMQTDASGNMSWVTPSGGDITSVIAGNGLIGGGSTGALTLNASANNGLNVDAAADRIQLGGSLIENTVITQNTSSMTFNLIGTGDFNIQDNGVTHFQVDNAGASYFGGNVYWKDINTGGTNLARLTDDGLDDGRFQIYENGNVSIDLDANTQSVFNEQGLDRNFRVESNDYTNIFFVDAGANSIGIRESSPVFDIHLKQSNNTQNGSGGIGFESSNTSINWKIYHSGLNLSFAENGTRRAYITSATGDYITTSDKRLKKDIVNENIILPKLQELSVYKYLYKDQSSSEKKSIGFLAQDVLPLFPELVETNEEGYLGLNYAGFGVLAIKAIQEQQDIIDTQQEEINNLKERLDRIETILNK